MFCALAGMGGPSTADAVATTKSMAGRTSIDLAERGCPDLGDLIRLLLAHFEEHSTGHMVERVDETRSHDGRRYSQRMPAARIIQ